MLIGDAGYGIILAGAGLVFYRRIVRLASTPSAHLLIIFGLATMLWGILTANYFGITPQTLIDAGHQGAANIMLAVAPLWRSEGEEARDGVVDRGARRALIGSRVALAFLFVFSAAVVAALSYGITRLAADPGVHPARVLVDLEGIDVGSWVARAQEELAANLTLPD